MRRIYLCPWCISGLRSHAEKIYVGDWVGDRKCEICGAEGEDENVAECLWDTEGEMD